MATLQEIFVADLKSITIDLDNKVFTYGGQDYECIPSSIGDASMLEVGGFSEDSDLSISVLKELFTDNIYPTSQQKIIYKSKTYRIHTVRQDVTDAFIRLSCIDDSKGV